MPIVIAVATIGLVYLGVHILLNLTTVIIGLSIATILGAIGYKMIGNTKSGCDLFNTKGCK